MDKTQDRNETVNNGITNNPSDKESEANMEDTRTRVQKIIDGDANLHDFDFPNDFEMEEIKALLDAKAATFEDIGESYAKDYLENGLLSLDDLPFEKFSPKHQIWLMQHDVVNAEEFRKQADLKSFTEDEWLKLLQADPDFKNLADWKALGKNGGADEWLELLSRQPQFAPKADWARIQEECSKPLLFEALADVPDLYCHIQDRQSLRDAGSCLWAGLIAEHPQFADEYPLDELDEVDEVGQVLLHQPQLVWGFTWNENNLPVKLFITNEKPVGTFDNGLFGDFIDIGFSKQLRPFLAEILHYGDADARYSSRKIVRRSEFFAGIYSRSEAKFIIAVFNDAMAKNGFGLTIRKEAITFGIDPQNELEDAILAGDSKRVIRAAVAGERIKNPDILTTEGFTKCSLAAVALVIERAMSKLDFSAAMNYFQLNHLTKSPVYALLKEAENRVPLYEDEKRLVKAIHDGNSEQVISMVTKEHIRIRSHLAMLKDTGHLDCNCIWNVSKKAIVTLLAEGTGELIKADILDYLLMEVGIAGTHIEDYPYDEAIMHVNVLIHIMMGELSADDAELIEQDWYPFGKTVDDGTESDYRLPYSYVYDPEHRYKPRKSSR